MKQFYIHCIFSFFLIMFPAMPTYAFHAFSEKAVHPDPTTNFKSSISMQIAGLSGLASEYAYSNGNKISQLDWQLQPLFLLGSTINVQFIKMIFFNAGYWSGINQNLGIIEDYDYATNDVPIIYSKHDSRLQKARFFDINAGYTQKIFNELSITGLIGFNSIDLKMAALDGYYEYPPGSISTLLFGTVITTEQVYNIPYFGLGINIEFLNLFFAQLMVTYTWIFTSHTIDSHYRRQIEFYSSLANGQQFSVMAKGGWKINENASLVLSVEYTKITTNRGESYSIDLNDGLKSTPSPNTASSGFYASSVGLSIEHSIRWLQNP